MLTCRETTYLVSNAQERTLTRRERWQVGMHLAMCRGCRNFGRQVKVLSSIGRAYTPGDRDRGE